jgi:hypothetical protein
MNAYNLCQERYEEIHVTIPQEWDIHNNLPWTYPHITFLDAYSTYHVFIGHDRYGNRIPVDKKGCRVMLKAGEWTLFHNVCSDMAQYYTYV